MCNNCQNCIHHIQFGPNLPLDFDYDKYIKEQLNQLAEKLQVENNKDKSDDNQLRD